jgi:DNA-binding winged helix-turn-helix (wHTH) protein/Tol biopolymer transport system component
MTGEANQRTGSGSSELRGILRFGPFEFELPAGRLSRDGIELPITPKAAAVLSCLLRSSGELISKDQFLESVWQDVHVREESLTQAISVIRRALGDSSQSPRFIQTITGVGYRFIAEVSANGRQPNGAAQAPEDLRQPLLHEAMKEAGPSPKEAGASPREAGASPGETGESTKERQPGASRHHRAVAGAPALMPWIITGFVTLVAAGIVWHARSTPADPSATRPLRFSFNLPADTVLPRIGIDISPSGEHVAFVAQQPDSTNHLYIWDSSTNVSTLLPGTEGISTTPFFSADGEWVGFFSEYSLKKVAVSGGRPEVVTTLPISAAYTRGATWTDTNQIVYSYQRGGLHVVSADGGQPAELSREDWWYVDALPGGRVILGARADGPNGPLASADEATISALWLDQGNRETVVMSGGYMPRYVAPGYLVFVVEGSLLAAPFDSRTAQIIGPPVEVIDGVRANQRFGAATYAISRNGTLVFAAGDDLPDTELLLVDREGNRETLAAEPQAFHQVAVSPDATKLALTIGWHAHQLWVLDLLRSPPALDPLLLGQDAHYPLWMPNSTSLLFNVAEGSAQNLFRISSPGAEPQRLTRSGAIQRPLDASRDGRELIFTQGADTDLWILPLDDAAKPRPLIATDGNEAAARLHPGGAFVAYQSDRSGQDEVYVAPYPVGIPSTRVSTEGGVNPRWSQDGDELFYQSGRTMWSVDVAVGPEIHRGAPKPLFEADFWGAGSHWDILPDGRGFVIISSETPGPITQISVVVNWAEELERLVRAGR